MRKHLLLACFTALSLAACVVEPEDEGGDDWGVGGSFSTGSVTGAGGAPVTGGAPGTGGFVASGGGVGTGGIFGAGGVVGAGGIVGAGGVIGAGGDLGSGGSGTGGDLGTGGGTGGYGTGGYATGGAGTGGSATGGTGGGSTGGTGGGSTGGSGTGGSGTGGSGTGGSGGTANTFVEDEGTDCTVGSLPAAGSLPTIAKLPDPFKKIDGTTISKKSDWRCRRAEIKKQAEQYIYGAKPPKPATVSGTVTSTSITVNVSDNGKSTSFQFSVELPSTGTGPFPALVSYGGGFLGFSHNALVKSEGVAIINFDPYVIGAESGASRSSKKGKFYDLYSNSQTGLLVAWAWGVSRIIDVIQQSGGNILRADVGVAGCSRFGKGAFTAGVFDQRVALTIPFESGSGGVPIWRGIPGEGAQSPSSAYGETYWLGDAFSAFTSGVTKLPVDTHEMVAMIAPRGLLILDNPHIANLGPKSAHVAALAGAEVYKALGAGTNISYHSSVASGTHCEARPEHQQPLRDNVRKFLLKTGNANGVITAASKATGNLADWREWTTPTLN